MRVRQRSATRSVILKPGQQPQLLQQVSEYIREDAVPNGNACYHWKVITPGQGPAYTNGEWNYLANYSGPDATVMSMVYPKIYVALDFVENNSFELIPTLFDLDATISMFTRKFLKQLSYGSVTWGILPFISDVKGVLSSCRDIMSRIPTGTTQFERGYELSADLPIAPYRTAASFNGKVHLAGTYQVRLPDYHRAVLKGLSLLDELGIHPDLRTAWDIVPLSFVVDYFIPIGDLLESLHPRGWTDYSVYFKGWQTISGTYVVGGYPYNGTNVGLVNPSFVHSVGRLYHRQWVERQMPAKEPVPVDWQTPTLKELFNTAYLLSSMKRLF